MDQNTFDISSPDYQRPEAISNTFSIETPRDRSMRELAQLYAFTPRSDVGFFQRVGNAFASETVIGEVLREINSPNFRNNGYVVTEKDIERFASDIDPAAARRAAAASDSIGEFIYEIDEIRLTQKRRQELFSGGGLGMAAGFGLTLLAAGGEAVGLSLLAGAAGSALGPGGSIAAGGGVALNRATRMKGFLKAMGMAAAIDVPLESTRYVLDKSLRPSDVVMALGASAALSGGLGAWKPHLFFREMQSMSDVATANSTAAALREAGEDALANEIEQAVSVSVRVVDAGEEVENIASLKGTRLFKAAEKAGVKTQKKNKQGTMGRRKESEIREELLDRSRKSATPEQVRKQVLREIEGKDVDQLKRMATVLKVKDTGPTEKIIERIIEAKIEIGRTGKSVKVDAPRMSPSLGGSLRKTVPVKKAKVELKGTFEKILWKIGTARDKNSEIVNEAREILKERGFKDPDGMAKEFVKKVRAAKKTEGKKFVADAEKMKVSGVSRKLKDGTVVSGFTRQTEAELFIDSDILGVKMITIDGKPTVEIPEEFAGIMDEAVDLTSTPTPPRRTISEAEGLREKIAVSIDHFGGNMMAYFFKPMAYRMLGLKNEEARRFAHEFLTMGREGTHDRMLTAKMKYETFTGNTRTRVNAARMEAWEQGKYKITDAEILRAVRSGQKFEGPLGEAVEAIRSHFREVKEHGTNRGMPLESIPDDLRYVTRRYRHSKFNELVETLTEPVVRRMFRDAILSHSDAKAKGVTKAKATAAAKRIVDWGTRPDEVISIEKTKIQIEKIRGQLIEDGIPEEEVDSFLELIAPKISTEPHLSVAKRRIDMNENYVDPETGTRIDEFFVNDLDELVNRYTKQIVGGAEIRIGLQKLYGKADIPREDVKNRIVSAGNLSSSEAELVERVVDRVFREMSGQHIHPDTNKTFLKMIYASNAFSQATIGMTLGFAAITEISSVICRNGIRAAFQQFPKLKEMKEIFLMGATDLRTGRQGLGLTKLDEIDELGSVLQSFTAIAGDYARGDHFMRAVDDAGFDSDYVKANSMKFLRYGQTVSFLTPLSVMPMDTFLRRWAGRAAFQNFINMTFKKGPDGTVQFTSTVWNNQKVRLKQMGLDEKDMTRLKKALERPGAVEFKDGVFGGKVKSFNPEAFDDPYIFNKFAVALRKHTDSTIQRQSYGEMPEFWTSPVGKLLGQYRVFMIASKTKQMAAGIARGDAIEAANVIAACGLGSIAYYLQTHYRSLSMDAKDRREYLEKRLSSEYIFRAGPMKSQYSNIFPMLVDMASTTVGGDPIFDPSMRTTGMGVDPIKGSVVYSVYYKRLLPVLRELTGAVFREDEVSKQDLRNAQGLAWPLMMPGVYQGVNQFLINPLNIPEKD